MTEERIRFVADDGVVDPDEVYEELEDLRISYRELLAEVRRLRIELEAMRRSALDG